MTDELTALRARVATGLAYCQRCGATPNEAATCAVPACGLLIVAPDHKPELAVGLNPPDPRDARIAELEAALREIRSKSGDQWSIDTADRALGEGHG